MADEQDRKTSPPNLDLIEMVQRARMMHDEDAQPSQMAAVYWIEAKRPADFDAPAPTAHSGEWMIETDIASVDAVWAKIKAATEAGQLGYKSKVSTAEPHNAHSSRRSIRVRTYDATDRADVERVRAALESMGVTPLRYSTDRE